MHKKNREQNLQRIDPFLTQLRREMVVASVPLAARYFKSAEPVSFAERHRGDYVEAAVGADWGDAWDSAWFNLKAEIPADWKGTAVAARIDLNGEALIFDASGCPVYGLSGGTIFLDGYRKTDYMLSESCAGGEAIDLWVEAAANNIMGVGGKPSRVRGDETPPYMGRVKQIELVQLDLERWHLILDLEVLASMLRALGEGPRRNRIIRGICDAIDMKHGQGAGAAACREHLKHLWTPANASDLNVTGIGHAHIDTGWLWPVKETVRKCARTFASQLAVIEKYPDYVFGASQPQHYQFVKDRYPALFEKIKAAVKAGRWELQGGMWVEADCNIISGESMVRQFIHGKNFFMDEFGEDVRNLWLPDVFGYSAAMPQILRKCGVDFFMTQKISWNQFNAFPFHLFNWKGVDGTSVVTHFLPEENYNSQVSAESMIRAQERFNENDRCDEFVSLYGIGDGGGGATEEMVERGLRMQNLEGCPKWKAGKAGTAFERMREHSDDLATWSGELYLELHRGTLTSQARVKKCNRQLENKLRAIEFLYASLPLARYPAGELDRIWKLVLLNQFHDILPGSSIDQVYQQTHREYAECQEACECLVQQALDQLLHPDDQSLTLVNVLSYDYSMPILLPEHWAGFKVVDKEGGLIAVQNENGRSVAHVVVPATGSLTLRKGEKLAVAEAVTGDLVLENELVSYTLDSKGCILRGFDKEQQREFIAEPANILSLYEDTPLNYDAWDIDVYYEGLELERAKPVSGFTSARGVVRDVINFDLAIGNSTIRQTISLAKNSKRIDFDTTVDWQEEHRMLRVAFPTTMQTGESTCDIQYSHVKRPNHRNTSWDMAKFEVAAHKYVDLSDSGYGVALLNDCKYGFKILDNVIDMNLLRSPKCPDPTADIGSHQFMYSLLPHRGTLVESSVIAEANMLNHPPVMADGFCKGAYCAPCRIEGEGASLEVVKKAEKETCLVIRLVETLGRHSRINLIIADPSAQLVPTNLMEWEDGDEISCREPVALTLKPFEIMTYKIKGQGA